MLPFSSDGYRISNELFEVSELFLGPGRRIESSVVHPLENVLEESSLNVKPFVSAADHTSALAVPEYGTAMI